MTSASAVAMAAGLVNLLAGRGERNPVVLHVGDRAPDFVLPGSDGQMHRLGDLAGRSAVVIAWFPRAFTGGCTVECRSITSAAEVLKRYEVCCFAASVDRPEVNRQFAEALNLGYPVLSDPTREVARRYGVLGPAGFARRWTFYIDADARLRAIDRTVRVGSHGSDMAATLDRLKVPRKT